MTTTGKDLSLTRIGVFYDGNFFFHVSNYYNWHHERKKRISISGLHHFIRHHVAKQEGTDQRLCQIVDAHYFRGRLRGYPKTSERVLEIKTTNAVIPAKAGIHLEFVRMDTCFRRYDKQAIGGFRIGSKCIRSNPTKQSTFL